jgi:hypothetical protein
MQSLQKKHDLWFNCYRTIEFSPDGTATVVLTGIANLAKYKIGSKSERIKLRAKSPGDMPKTMKFQLVDDHQIVNLRTDKFWRLREPL